MFEAPNDLHVRRSIRWLYVGSLVLFLATIVLGFVNVFTSGELSRGQILAHFHSGSIGWITLSVIATTLWAFTAGRDTGPGIANFAALMAGIGALAVAGYITAFGLAFNGDAPLWMLPMFGIPSGLVIISAFLFTLHQRRHVTWTMPHLLLCGALMVASLGATMGILIGLQHAGFIEVFTVMDAAIGGHAGPMDMYLALAFAAIVEARLGGDLRITAMGKAQVGLGVLSGFMASAAILSGIGPLIPVALLLFLAAFVLYMIRIGWKAFRHGFGDGARSATTLGAAFFPIYILMFVYLVFAFFAKDQDPPHALLVAFVHVTFVGMATNLIFATHASQSQPPASFRMGI